MLGNAGAVSHPIEGPLSYVLLSTAVVTLLSQTPQPTVFRFSKQTVWGQQVNMTDRDTALRPSLSVNSTSTCEAYRRDRLCYVYKITRSGNPFNAEV